MSDLAAVVFDFDGLIVDTETGAYLSTKEVFDEHGVQLSRAEWQSFVGTTDHIHWLDLLQQHVEHPLDREALAARRNEQKLALLMAEEIRPGVVTLIEGCEAAGIPIAVASSSPRLWVTENLERLALLDRFRVVITRDDVGGEPRRTKPAPDLYEVAVEALGTPAAASVAIEDSLNGVKAAKAAGMACVAVPAGMTADVDLSMADLVVASLADVTVPDLAALVAP